MRALRWPDAFPKEDIAVRNNLGGVTRERGGGAVASLAAVAELRGHARLAHVAAEPDVSGRAGDPGDWVLSGAVVSFDRQ